MRILIIAILTITISYAKIVNYKLLETYKQQLYNLTPEQYKILYTAYGYGMKYDLGYTLTAIAWKESIFGKIPVNVSDRGRHSNKFYGAYGPYHILIDSVMYLYPRSKRTKYFANVIATKLLFNLEYSTNTAIKLLLFWKKYWIEKSGETKLWSKIVGSYNAGFNSIYSKKGRLYRDDIYLRVKALQYWMKHKNSR